MRTTCTDEKPSTEVDGSSSKTNDDDAGACPGCVAVLAGEPFTATMGRHVCSLSRPAGRCTQEGGVVGEGMSRRCLLTADHDGNHSFHDCADDDCASCGADGRPEPEGAKRPEARPPPGADCVLCGGTGTTYHRTEGTWGLCACAAVDRLPPCARCGCHPNYHRAHRDGLRRPSACWWANGAHRCPGYVAPEPEARPPSTRNDAPPVCGACYGPADGRGDTAICTLLPGHLGGHGQSYAAAHGRGPAFMLGQELTAGQVRTIDRSSWQPNPRPAVPCGAKDRQTGDLCELPAGHARLHHATIHDDAGQEIGGHGWSDPRSTREAVALIVAQQLEDCGAGCGYENGPPPTDVEIATSLLSDGARELETAHRHLNAQRAKCRVAEARVTELEADVQRLVRERDIAAEAAEASRLEAGQLATKARTMIADAKKLAAERDEAREAEAAASHIADKYAGAHSALVELLAAQEAVQEGIGEKDMARRRLCRAWDQARGEAIVAAERLLAGRS